MKTTLLFTGKTTGKLYAEGIADYANRVGHYMPFEVVTIPDLKGTKALTEEQQKQKEGEMILRQVQEGDTLVLLDERGRQLSSVDFAEWLAKRQQTSRRIVFAIGGPYGFSKAVYDRANELLSVSKMTFSHQMVRLVFAEQLYRACTIIKGDPYHHA